MSAKLWRFDALDSWFFRESRPHETVGGTELASLFPPPARTVAGAVRTLIGETQQMGWDKFKEPEGYSDLKQQIGDADGFGQLQLTGPYLCKGGQRLYPVPLHLLTKTEAGQEKPKFACLRPGTEPVDCDLGRRIRLPELARCRLEARAGWGGTKTALPQESAIYRGTEVGYRPKQQPPHRRRGPSLPDPPHSLAGRRQLGRDGGWYPTGSSSRQRPAALRWRGATGSGNRA